MTIQVPGFSSTFVTIPIHLHQNGGNKELYRKEKINKNKTTMVIGERQEDDESLGHIGIEDYPPQKKKQPENNLPCVQTVHTKPS